MSREEAPGGRDAGERPDDLEASSPPDKGRSDDESPQDEDVDEQSSESFPASDPPSW